jgi:hypothetical protein
MLADLQEMLDRLCVFDEKWKGNEKASSFNASVSEIEHKTIGIK